MLGFLLLSSSFVLAATLLPSPREFLYGPCQELEFVEAFDVDKFVNVQWFEIGRYDNGFESDFSCVKVFFAKGSETHWDIIFSMVTSDGSLNNQIGEANLTAVDSNVSMAARFPGDDTWSSFIILDTDYSNYALVYGCLQLNSDPSLPEKLERFWVLGQQPVLSEEVQVLVDKYLNSTQLGDYLSLTNQTDCSTENYA